VLETFHPLGTFGLAGADAAIVKDLFDRYLAGLSNDIADWVAVAGKCKKKNVRPWVPSERLIRPES